MSKQHKKRLTQHIVTDTTPVVQESEHFGAIKKYENRHVQSLQAMAANAIYAGTAQWKYKDTNITVGPNQGGKPSSVKAKIRKFVAENGEMNGAMLVTRLFHEVNFTDSHNSEYVKGGKPTLAWIEDYVAGCLRSNSQVLMVSSEPQA